ncbi:hypothetical protein DFP73DRAFT_347782 [Morchella snyderi]|nr:hypothetical protein DFP73DRAFT_347782 [Morchella snyderi]
MNDTLPRAKTLSWVYLLALNNSGGYCLLLSHPPTPHAPPLPSPSPSSTPPSPPSSPQPSSLLSFFRPHLVTLIHPVHPLMPPRSPILHLLRLCPQLPLRPPPRPPRLLSLPPRLSLLPRHLCRHACPPQLYIRLAPNDPLEPSDPIGAHALPLPVSQRNETGPAESKHTFAR